MGKRINISELTTANQNDSGNSGAKSGQEEHQLTDKQLETLLNNIAFNLKDLIKLDHNVMQMRRRLYEFLQALHKVEKHVREQARKDGEKEALENLNKSTSRLIEHIDTKLKESEKRLRSIDDRIPLPTTTVYVAFVIMVALFTFMLCTLIWNLHFLHDSQIWKYFGGTIGLTAIGIFMVLYIPKWIDRIQKR